MGKKSEQGPEKQQTAEEKYFSANRAGGLSTGGIHRGSTGQAANDIYR
jgi:hypothetical protein